MTKYYTNKDDFSRSSGGSGTSGSYSVMYNNYGSNTSSTSESEITRLLDKIDAVTKVVQDNDCSSFYKQVGDASLGKDMPKNTFTNAHESVQTILSAAARIHDEVVQRIDSKFTHGLDKSFSKTSAINDGKNEYKTDKMTYDKEHTGTYTTPQINGGSSTETYTYTTKEHYTLNDLLSNEKSPIKATQEVYKDRVKNLRQQLTEANGYTEEEVKKLKGMSDSEAIKEYGLAPQHTVYEQLRSNQWYEDNKKTLDFVAKGVTYTLLAVAAVAAIASTGGAALPAVVATAAEGAAVAGTTLAVADAASAYTTGGSFMTGQVMSEDEKVFAAASAVVAVTTFGAGRYLGSFSQADDAAAALGDTSAVSSQINTARAVSNAANYADYGVNITQMGYNKIVKGEDPDWTRLASLGVSAVNNHNANIREARAQAGDMDFTASPVRSQQLSDIDSPHVNPADIDLPSQSGHISTVHEGTSGHAPDVAPSKVHDLDAGAAGAVAGAKASKVQSAKPSEVEAPTRAGEVAGSKGSDVTRAKVEAVEKPKDYTVTDFRKDMESLPHIDLSQKVEDGIVGTPNGKRPDVNRVYSQDEINQHLSMFEDGIVKVVSGERYRADLDNYGTTIGAPNGQFVMPKSVYEKAVKASNGNPRVLEELLTLEPGSLGDAPKVIESHDFTGLRMPSGNEAGAYQGDWIPGGYTKGGTPEAIIDQLPEGHYTVDDVY
ncbi:Uncharacterised protein [Streptococcus criceti]|uniref:LXG domain-containing protein n=1 Tax=Streptococcus criceti HS-6 TaxID=873449 RepID=G5JNU0_STRCG|nr:hypothetical protein [Streptococcus criceti]EHI74453.1 hypothetical protein STRCR_0253 [Streptococcus criceti HS-6]SUN41749.1 Uncharacterised protein [Streptococcus criceti]